MSFMMQLGISINVFFKTTSQMKHFVNGNLDTNTFTSKAQAFEGSTSGPLSTDIYRHVTNCIFVPHINTGKNHILDLLPHYLRCM